MKRILAFIALVLAFSGAFGQESTVQEEMQFFSKTLAIETEQRAQLSKILIRKQAQLDEIASIAQTDQDLYREKRRNIHIGTEHSIKMMLDENQLKHWHTYQSKSRKANAEKVTALKRSNASMQDVLDAQIGIYH
ncbi:hypothetical protein [Portibacter marinus]|uniref:hypothetical protein n=1 Tax=Portibacter marinus TaxID=2898660 RepID=UPI001F38A030|nr:hypothetical protein [Portibacter marinus]